MTGLQCNEIKEMNEILIDLKATIQSLSKVAARLDKCLKGYEQPVTDDENGFQSAEEDANINVKSIQQRANVWLKRQKESGKSSASKSENTKNTENIRRFSRAKSLTNEAINETIVNNKEKKRDNAVKVKSNHVKDIKKKFEVRNDRSFDDSDESSHTVRSNSETISEKIKSEEVNVNVRSLLEKFEQEKKELKIEKPKVEEKVKVADEQTNENKEKVKRVLKYFQPNRN